jgi:S-DNA-T family DNA segregation ATPase FtsK/SpoIIIE
MLFLSPRSSALTRAQGTLVDDGEVRAVVKFLKTIAQASFEPQLLQIRAASSGEESALNPAERDPLFEKAVEVILETKRGSVSLLQRRLTIGYARASRLIEQMGEYGIIGEYKGSQAREVQITLEDWEAMKAQLAATEADGTLYAGSSSADLDDTDPQQQLSRLAGAEDDVDEDLEDESDDDSMTDEERELARIAEGDEAEDQEYEDEDDDDAQDDEDSPHRR